MHNTNMTINVTNDQFKTNTVYSIQVAAVNVVGQGPISKTTLSEFALINRNEIFKDVC